jgi:hypothetical protein
MHGFVGAEEIQHAHDVGVVDLGERAAFLEEALHPIAERRQVLGGGRANDIALGTQHERRRQVFLDGDRCARIVESAIDDRKAAAADLAINPVIEQLVSGGECLVGDAHWACREALRLARQRDKLYILDNRGDKVKNSFVVLWSWSRIVALPPIFQLARLVRHGLAMILSMTGFAAVAAELPGCSLAVELRSVNHRYLDLQLRVPDELRALETAIREALARELKRGKIDCRISLNRTTPGAAALAINGERVAQLRDAASRSAASRARQRALSTVEILRWPGVLTEPSVDAGTGRATLLLVQQALAIWVDRGRARGAAWRCSRKTAAASSSARARRASGPTITLPT